MNQLQPVRRLTTAIIALAFLLMCHSAYGDNDYVSADASGARLLYGKESVEVKKDGTALYTFKRRIKVLSEKGKHQGALYFAETQFEKTLDATGRVYDSSGKMVLKRNKGDLEKYCGFSEYQLYSDICDYYLNLGAGNYPFTVEYEVSQTISSLFAWPGWRPQWFIPVDTSIYELTTPAEFTYRTKITGDVGEPAVSEDKGKRVQTWVLYDLPAFRTELFMPPVGLYAPGLDFVVDRFKYGKYDIDCSDWSAASRSIDNLMKAAFKLSKAQQLTLDSIVPTRPITSQGCNQLHDFLAKRSRYVAVSIGVGGWQPHPSDVTFAHGYGDCKDLSTMYASMLRQVDVTAKLALVMTKDDGRTDPIFPWLNFNHVIVYYLQGPDTVWVDPTCFSCRLGDLPWTDEGIFVLTVDSTRGMIVQTPASLPEENVITRKASVSLNADLSVSVVIDIHAVGNPGNELRGLAGTLSALEFAERLKKYQGIVSEALLIKECKIETAATNLSEIRIGLRGSIQRYARQVNGKLYFDLSIFPTQSHSEMIDLNRRQYPVEFEYPYAYIDTISVRLPADYQIGQIPKDTSVNDQFGLFRLSGQVNGGEATLTRYKTLAVSAIDTTAFGQFAEHRAGHRKLAGQSLVAEKR
jgi:hypothetical protein